MLLACWAVVSFDITTRLKANKNIANRFFISLFSELAIESKHGLYFFSILIFSGTLSSGMKTGLSDGQKGNNSGLYPFG